MPIQSGMIVCLNGQFMDAQAARISVFDHGLLYGDGVFDTIAAVDSRMIWLEEHIDRLLDGCRRLSLKITWSRDALMAWTAEVFERNASPTVRLRITITRGIGDVPIYETPVCTPTLIIFATPLDLPCERTYVTGVSLMTTRYRRVCPEAKSLNFLGSVLGYLDASSHGYDDALFVDDQGDVLEGATSNVFTVNNNVLATPATGILPGVTRAKVIDLARASGYHVCERRVSLKQLQKADEVFITGTTKRLVPVSKVDGVPIGAGEPGAVTLGLLTQFRATFY